MLLRKSVHRVKSAGALMAARQTMYNDSAI